MDLTNSTKMITKVVKTLCKDAQTKVKEAKEKNLQLLFDDDIKTVQSKVNLMITLIKIPPIPENGQPRREVIRSSIPHSFINETFNVLLITCDVKRLLTTKNDFDPIKNAYRKILNRHEALKLVTEIMPLSQLRYEYSDFESRRNLASQYDVILCDRRVIGKVPFLLGKAFYRGKKRPISVNLKAKDVRRAITEALSRSYLYLDLKGNCAMSQVGLLSQTPKQVAENVMATLKNWKENVPGGWENVRSLHLKSDTSISIPLYLSLESKDKVRLDYEKLDWATRESNSITALANLSTRQDSTFAVSRFGNVVECSGQELHEGEVCKDLEKMEKETRKNELMLVREKIKARKEHLQRIGEQARKNKRGTWPSRRGRGGRSRANSGTRGQASRSRSNSGARGQASRSRSNSTSRGRGRGSRGRGRGK